MKLHTLAKLFPPMSDYEFELLQDDIKTNGCHTPLWLYDDMIIDGRHRFAACEELGITPEYKTFAGTEEEMLAFVISQNLHRRHLSETQRATVAAELANMTIGNPKGKKTMTSITQPTAARMLNVSQRSLSSAKVIKDNGSPLLKDKVAKGEITVSAGEKITKLPHEQQDEAIKKGAKTATELTKIALVSKPGTAKGNVYKLITISKDAGGRLVSEVYDSKSMLLKAVTVAIKEDSWDSITVEYNR